MAFVSPYRLSLRQIIMAIIILGAAGIVIASIQQTRTLRHQLTQLQQATPTPNDEEVKKLVAQISQLIVLPTDETPTLATITDRTKLAELPFFAKAENDDKVLIYIKARKAILYRPALNKIIEVAAVNLDNTATPQTFSPKLALRNGTSAAGLTKKAEDALKEILPSATIVSRDNAKTSDITKTIVVNLTGQPAADAQKLAATINAQLGDIPAEESKPEGADFLIILGADKAESLGFITPTPTPTP